MKTDIQNLRQFLNVRGIASYHLLSVLSSVSLVTTPLLVGRFIDALVYGQDATSIFCLLLGVVLFNLFTTILSRRIICRLARQQELELQIHLLTALQGLKPAAIDGYRNGEVGMKFFRDTEVVCQFISNMYPQILNAAMGTIWALLIVIYKSPWVVSVIIFVLLLTGLSLAPYRKCFRRLNHVIRAMYDRSMNGIFEFMRVFPYLKSLNAEDPYVELPKSKFSRFKIVNSFKDHTVVSFEFINRALICLGEYGILGIAGWFAWRQVITVGDVVVFQVLFLSVLNSISGLFHLIPSLELTSESVRSINELLNGQSSEDILSGSSDLMVSGNISVQHVTFSYAHSSRKILDNFSCEIHCGSIVALSGSNGAGKTTLLKLISGYLEPSCGIIEIAGAPLSSWQKKAFREKVSAVFQDELIISGTIRDNITLKNRKYSKQELEDALHLSGADSLVRRMPEGLEHRIGLDGGGLSGGERQKVAIARALIRQPDILIFDEVTNHLDYESRCMVKNLLNTLRGRTTVLIVSHDPEILSLCDEILNLPEPSGTESGN